MANYIMSDDLFKTMESELRPNNDQDERTNFIEQASITLRRAIYTARYFSTLTERMVYKNSQLRIPKCDDDNRRACINVFHPAEEDNTHADAKMEKMAQEWHKSHRARKDVVIFHHNDLDGEGSAAIIRHMMFPKNKQDITFCKCNYTDMDNIKEVTDRMKKKDPLSIRYAIITDLSFTNSLEGSMFAEIIHNFDFILWIDHHKSSFNNLNYLIGSLNKEKRNKKPFHFIGYLDTRFSAALLAYVIFNDITNPVFRDCTKNRSYKIAPDIPLLISDYDTVNRASHYHKLSLWFNRYYWTMQDMEPESPIWELLLQYSNSTDMDILEYTISSVLTTGRDLHDLEMKRNKIVFNNETHYSIKTVVGKYDKQHLPIPTSKVSLKMLGIHGYGNYEIFENCLPDKDEYIFALIRFKKDKFNISLYHINPDSKLSTKLKLNLGKIVQEKFKGGGHPTAAGFSMNTKDFLKAYEDYYIKRSIHIENPIRQRRQIRKIFGIVFNIIADAIVKDAKMEDLEYWKN